MFAMQAKRFHNGQKCAISRLFINGVYECFLLEDKVREVPGESVAVWKIPHQTAIPVGTYDVTIDFSNRFQRLMPHILNVPGFDGIRIHPGNSDVDTDGCPLTGQEWSENKEDWVSHARLAFDVFFPKLQDAIANGEKPTITITNEFEAPDPSGEIAT